MLKEKYGYCIVPKGTILYRGHNETNVKDVMFFATKKGPAYAFNDSIQIWRSLKDIELIFLVEEVQSLGKVKSSLPLVYNSLFPDEADSTFTDLDIKHCIKNIDECDSINCNLNRRNKLINKLNKEHSLDGWFTSIENNVDVEICLFNKNDISSFVTFLEVIDIENSFYYRDSLKRLKIYPSHDFYQNSEIKMKQKPLKEHKKYIKACIEYHLENYDDAILSHEQHSFFNLRLKLKI